MNVLSTNRRKVGAIALIAAGIIAVAVPFLLHSPLNANPSTTTSGNGSGGNTNTNTNPTSNAGSSQNSGSNSGTGSNSGSGSGTCNDNEDKDDTAGDPSHGHGQGNAYAYGHGKGGDRDKDPLHAIMNRLSRLGSDSPAFHHHNSTRTDNGLGQENSQGNVHSASNHRDACPDDDENETD